MQKLFSLTRRLLILGFIFYILLANLLYSQDNVPRKVVTIFPFHFASTDVVQKKTISELNGLFYDLFTGQFAGSGYFEVVDRQHIMELIEEMKLQQSGLTKEQVIEIGKIKGAELAIFGTVTNVYKQTFLTLKIIDIETSVILKSIKAKGSLKKPDKLALNAGIEFMNGLSRVLFERYNIGAGKINRISRDGLEYFLKARDLIQQAIIAEQDGNNRKKNKFQQKAEKYLSKAVAIDSGLKAAIDVYRDNMKWQLEE